MIIHEDHEHAERLGGVTCFRCDETVHAPMVLWIGRGADGEASNIVFHPMCASRFGAQFMDDVHALEE